MDLIVVLVAVLFSAIFWFWLIRRKDRFAPKPFWFLCKIALLGGVLSVIPSAVLNSIFIADISEFKQAPFITALLKNGFIGLNEEFWKLAATIYLVKNHIHFDEPVDGIIYAATVALGFAAIENIEYISRHGLGVLVIRHFISVPGHLAFAMLWGYGLTLAKFKYPDRHWVSVIWPYYLAAAFFHGLFNFSATFLPGILNILVITLLVVFLYHFSSKRSRQLLLHSPLRPAGHCPECGTTNKETNLFCDKCGMHLEVSDEFPLLKRIACPQCEASNRMNARFCARCGVAFAK